MDFLDARCHEMEPDGSLQVMYGIDGRHVLTETTLDHLEGYRGSHPVRLGNDAYKQLQLDIYGELMDRCTCSTTRQPDFVRTMAVFTAIDHWCARIAAQGLRNLGVRAARKSSSIRADVLGGRGPRDTAGAETIFSRGLARWILVRDRSTRLDDSWLESETRGLRQVSAATRLMRPRF